MIRSRYRLSAALLSLFVLGGCPNPSYGQPPDVSLEEVDIFFPSDPGSRWSYFGSVVDEIQRVTGYLNEATIKGTTEKDGITVKVFAETNQANTGPAESYFVIDQKGIRYYGRSPTNRFEEQIVPYTIISFPIFVGMTFSQMDKRNLDFGQDLDQDGTEERVDVRATMSVLGFEDVSVPGGVFEGCLKLKGEMLLWITLSGSQTVVQMVDTTLNWFAPGVGLVKWKERTDFPSIAGRPPKSLLISEELKSFTLSGPPTP